MTQRQTVYSMLRRAHKDGVTNGAFAEAGILRYSARIKELRAEGHPIVRQRISGKCFKYTLLEGSAPTAAPASGDRPLPGGVGLPRPEYQAGAGAAVDAELIPIKPKPLSPYEYEREVA